MTLINFKIKVADIADVKKSSRIFVTFDSVQVSACKTRSIYKKNKMVVVDCMNGNSTITITIRGYWVIYPSSGVTVSNILEFTMFYRLKRKSPNKIK